MERNRIASWWIRWADLDWPNQDNMDKIKRRAEGLAKALFDRFTISRLAALAENESAQNTKSTD